MLRYALGGLAFVCLGGAAVSFLISFYNMLVMLSEPRSDSRKTLSLFLGPLALFIPQLWTDKGNRARKRFLFYSVLFGDFFSACYFLLHIPLE